jgi:hypothetical protein
LDVRKLQILFNVNRPYVHTRRDYIVLASLIVLYVWMCSPHWENVRGADAWEHHRAVVALSRQMWRPGNPTYATPEPSVRYSPYSLGLAILARASGADPYNLLCFAAVTNTVLLMAGLYALLSAYRQQTAAAAVLAVVVVLWGEAPGYANSLALADLPWHQMNPSAFAMALVMLLWALVHGGERGPAAPFFWPALGVVGAVVLLTHAMTGVFGFGGLLVLALVAPADRRARLLAAWGVITGIAAGLCLAWPWFDFLEAVRNLRDVDYWFNPYILQRMLWVWCAPAVLLCIVTLPYRGEELIRFCLLWAAGCYGLAVVSFLVHSPTLARLPMPATLLLQIAIGIFIHRTGLLRPATWPARLRRLWRGNSGGEPALEFITASFLIYLLLPQVGSILREPWLARPYVARLTHRLPRTRSFKAEYDRLLEPVGERDVVLGDTLTSWAVPSSRGRIVAALHYELFTPDQSRRQRDVEAFFGPASEAEREQIIKRYHVKYILVEPERLDYRVAEALLEPTAVVRRTERMVLLDAERWLASRASRATKSEQAAAPSQ